VRKHLKKGGRIHRIISFPIRAPPTASSAGDGGVKWERRTKKTTDLHGLGELGKHIVHDRGDAVGGHSNGKQICEQSLLVFAADDFLLQQERESRFDPPVVLQQEPVC